MPSARLPVENVMNSAGNQYQIRLARTDEVASLREIENAASELFIGLDLIDETNDPGISPERVATLINLGQAWVICTLDDQPVGMALTSEMGGEMHLEEIDVLPAYGRQGLGSRLLKHVCDRALEKGFRSITLSTFRDVPWNGPFYRKHGFCDLDENEWAVYMHGLRVNEIRCGLRVDARVFMRRYLRRQNAA